jgi:hypothetical protein
MGVVYEAEQRSLGRRVALKVLPQYRTDDPSHLERFQREARAAAMLHHTNIVPIFGVGEYNGVDYYAMQYIQGQSLDAVLREVKRLRGVKGAEPASGSLAGHSADLAASVAIELVSGRFEGQAAPAAAPVAMTASRCPPSWQGYCDQFPCSRLWSVLFHLVDPGPVGVFLLSERGPDRGAARRGARVCT